MGDPCSNLLLYHNPGMCFKQQLFLSADLRLNSFRALRKKDVAGGIFEFCSLMTT